LSLKIARLNQNSQHSSLPPTANRLGQNVSPVKRSSSGKKRGAQLGHKGHNRQAHPYNEHLQVEQYHPSTTCQDCGSKVVANPRPNKRHQVFELPKMLYEVTEHQAFLGHCINCGEAHQAHIPNTVSQSQMGPNLLAFIALQSAQFHQSIRKIQQHLSQSFGLSFSTGAISEAQGRVSVMLTQTHEAIKNCVNQSPLIYADETRHQRNGGTRWMWLSCSEQAAYFLTHYSRSKEAAIKLLGDKSEGYLITDQYSSYRYIDETQRQLCLAHIFRNIAAIAESGHLENKTIGKRLRLCLLSTFRCRHQWEQQVITTDIYERRLARLHKSWSGLLALGCYHCTSRYRGRCRLLLKDDVMVWNFERNHQLPLTNNEAERT